MAPDAADLTAIARVLVIKLRHHGDVLLSSPVFSVLRSHAPHLEIDALVYDDTREMVTLHPAISRVFAVGRAWRKLSLPRKLVAELQLLRMLRSRSYDLL